MNNINRYLVAHYPLLWNTRVGAVLGVNALLHLLFFITGYGAVDARSIKLHYSIWSVGGGSLFSFSILSSLLVLIVWLVYYLRNNAFKSMYPIGRWHLLKEYLLILLILFTTVTYFTSYNYGVRAKVRSITPVASFEKEVNTVNLAKAFLPTYLADYFILNNCAHKNRSGVYFNGVNFSDTINIIAGDTNQVRVRAAMRRPDAFSYQHYCTLVLDRYDYNGIHSKDEINARLQELVQGGDPALITQTLKDFEAICRKYGIAYDLDADSLGSAVLSSHNGAPRAMIPTTEYSEDRITRKVVQNAQYILLPEIEQAYGFLYESLPNPNSSRDRWQLLIIIGYVSIALSVLLLCYRRFSKKVFLVSIVGTLVWSIIIGLITATSRNATNIFPFTCVTLCLGFLLTALVLLKRKEGKTLSGTLLYWHIFLAPYFVLFLLMIASHSYEMKRMRINSTNELNIDSIMQQRYPFLYWVTEHQMLLSGGYLLVFIAYTAFLFNHWARRWQVVPYE